jgi:antitoxin ParD1/3/4
MSALGLLKSQNRDDLSLLVGSVHMRRTLARPEDQGARSHGRLCQFGVLRVEEVMPMATMNVSLPDQMKDWVEAQTRAGRYGNASDYVRDLIRRDQERADKLAELQKLITEGIESGISSRSMEEILKAARDQVANAARGHGI